MTVLMFNVMNIKLVVKDISKDLTPDGNVCENVIKDHLQLVNPQMVVLLTCYSRFSSFKTMFERNGTFAKMKLSRELCILSNGHFITLNKEQAAFIDKMAKRENIEKDIIITGAVGSGKTTLGEQVVVMKLNHYKDKYKLLPMNCKYNFRVIFLHCSMSSNRSAALIEQWKKELTKTIGNDCTLEVQGRKFGTDFIEANPMWKDYKHTIIVLDEFSTNNGYALIQLIKTKKKFISVDVVHCQQYREFFGQFDLQVKRLIKLYMLQQTPYTIFCSLTQSERSSQQIFDFAFFLQVHSEEKINNYMIRPYSAKMSFSGHVPIWLDLKSVQSLVDYANVNWKELEDVMVIFNEDTLNDDFKHFCQQAGWRTYNHIDVKGSEAHTVILICTVNEWGPWGYFELCTRARCQLIIVTFTDS